VFRESILGIYNHNFQVIFGVAGFRPGSRAIACRVPKGAYIVVEAKVAKQGARSSRRTMQNDAPSGGIEEEGR